MFSLPAKLLIATLSTWSHFVIFHLNVHERKGNWHEYTYLNVTSADDEPVMTDDERLAAIAKQYAVLNNRTSGSTLEFFTIIIIEV